MSGRPASFPGDPVQPLQVAEQLALYAENLKEKTAQMKHMQGELKKSRQGRRGKPRVSTEGKSSPKPRPMATPSSTLVTS